MKKLIALMLCLMLAFSMPVTAFAEGEQSGTTTLTAEVPEPTPSYTIHIPADTTLEYGNTEKQEIGSFYISDPVNVNNHIVCDLTITALTNGSNTISVKYYEDFLGEIESGESFSVYDKYSDGTIDMDDWTLFAQISQEAWSGAAPGTYTATLTFQFSIYED